MKIFLSTCIIAMISAGLYGTIDLARDISHNTYIQYEEGLVGLNANTASEKSLSNVIRKAREEVSTERGKKINAETPELKMEYFSRSSPSMFDERVLSELTVADSIANKSDTLRGVALEVLATNSTKPKQDSVFEEKKPEPKFDVSLFSRGRPRKPRVEVAVPVSDTLKK
jgi:hypothetical protein